MDNKIIKELSKDTLKSYVKKATKDKDSHTKKLEKHPEKLAKADDKAKIAMDALRWKTSRNRNQSSKSDDAIRKRYDKANDERNDVQHQGWKHNKTIEKRSTGIEAANKKLKESADLQELSKNTLRNYVHKAANHTRNMAHIAGYSRKPKEKEHYNKQAFKRINGISMAADKLAKESTMLSFLEFCKLDEISKSTLGSYVKKSHDQLNKHSLSFGHDTMNWSAKTLRKRKNRSDGINKAVDKLTKESADLQELSKNTLKSYKDKAENQYLGHSQRIMDTRQDSQYAKSIGDHSRAKEFDRRGENSQKIVDKREKGIVKANKKLKESADLQELSKSTLKSYVKKAAGSAVDSGYKAGKSKEAYMQAQTTNQETENKANYKKYDKKAVNRETGIRRAVDKLTKEETELQELSHATKLDYVRKATRDVQYKSEDKGETHHKSGTDAEASAKREHLRTKVSKRMHSIGRALNKVQFQKDSGKKS